MLQESCHCGQTWGLSWPDNALRPCIPSMDCTPENVSHTRSEVIPIIVRPDRTCGRLLSRTGNRNAPAVESLAVETPVRDRRCNFKQPYLTGMKILHIGIRYSFEYGRLIAMFPTCHADPASSFDHHQSNMPYVIAIRVVCCAWMLDLLHVFLGSLVQILASRADKAS